MSYWRVRWSCIFAVATALALFSTLQAYRMTAVTRRLEPGIGTQLLILNTAYWYVPALAAPLVLRLAQRFRFESPGWPRSLLLHLPAFALFSLIHLASMTAVRLGLWPHGGKPTTMSWSAFLQRNYFEQLDWLLMTYAALLALAHAIDYHRESRARAVRNAQLQTQLVQAQLKNLESQLHPHFLFNTLHAVSALIYKRPDAADRMICRLSDLLRLALEHRHAQEVSVKEEIEFLDKYLEIEQIRFQDRLTVRIDVDPEALDLRVPHLILQPLVENAIKHGIARKPGACLIEVTARRQGPGLWLEVHDDGGGLDGRAAEALEKGVGLSNVRERLERLFGPAYRLEFSNVGGGLLVRIVIPIRAHGAQDSTRVA
jgi:two-component sensor histidine kinase